MFGLDAGNWSILSLLLCSCCFLLDEGDMPGIQVPRHLVWTWPGTQVQCSREREQLHLGPQCQTTKVRKVQRRMSELQGPRVLPPESSLRVYPGCFHAPNQDPAGRAPPLSAHPPPDPTTRFGKDQLLYGVLARCSACSSTSTSVTRRLRIPGRKARCDFAYHPPNFSRLSSRPFPYDSLLPL